MNTALRDTSISEFVEKHYGSLFSRTQKLHNDYWYIWSKSGLLDFICKKLRSKYSIELLDYDEDYINGEIPINDFDSASIESHQFYDSWDRKDEFRKELADIIYQLRLHRSSFWFLFEKIFYDNPLDVNEPWSGDDSMAVYHLTTPLDEEFQFQGFTAQEIKIIKKEITSNFRKKLGHKKLSPTEKQAVDEWCSQLSRDSRPPKDKEVTYQVIEQMKRYKQTGSGRNDHEGFADVRLTAGKSASELVRQLPDESLSDIDYSDAWFRVFVKDLYERFPLLKEFIKDFQKN